MTLRRKLRRPPPRPGVTPAQPKDWPVRAMAARLRDKDTCRRCGSLAMAAGGQVDHIIPRRLFEDGAKASSLENLALLCVEFGCHAWKTQWLEPALYRGDILAFHRFLNTLALSGPIPDSVALADAYARLRELLTPTKEADDATTGGAPGSHAEDPGTEEEGRSAGGVGP